MTLVEATTGSFYDPTATCELITEGAVPAISMQQARDARMFGPLYHGTTNDLANIIAQGFDPQKSIPTGLGRYLSGTRPTGSSNGYGFENYGLTGIAAPVHHLGFGSYFTTVKAIAKQYSGGTMKGQREFYLDSQKVLKINFGASNTMMKWWRANGYDMTEEATRKQDFNAWIAATRRLTDTLSEKYDAVHFLGKGIRKLLDGDQVCVYRTELIRVIDPKLATGLEVGAKVLHTQTVPEDYQRRNDAYVDEWPSLGAGWKAIFNASLEDEWKRKVPFHFMPPAGMPGVITDVRDAPNGKKHYAVKWQKGGEQHSYREGELTPYVRTKGKPIG